MSKRLKKILPLLWLLVLLTILVQGARMSLFRPKVLVEGLVGQPHFINPLYADLNPVDQLLTSLVYRGLIKFNEAGLPEGDLAQNWKISEDGKTYTVTLKEGLSFHNGQKLTAYDAAFTYQLTQLPDHQGPKKKSFEEVNIEALSDQEIKFTLKEPFAPFLETLTLGVLPQSLWQGKNFDQILRSEANILPVGNGILKIKPESLKIDNQQEIRSLSFEILGSNLNAIQFKFYPNEESLVSAYKLGEIESLALTDNELAQKLLNWPNLTVQQKFLFGSNLILLFNNNLNDQIPAAKISADPVFREGVENLIPTSLWQVGSFGPVPKISWAYKTDLPVYNFDPVAVRDQLAGLDRPETLVLTVPQKPMLTALASTIQQELEENGLTIDLEILDTVDFDQKVIQDKDFELTLVAQKVDFDPDQYLYWHSSQKDAPGLNLSAFSNRRVDKNLELGKSTLDQEERKKYYLAFQDELTKERAAIFLNHPQVFYFYPKNLKIETPENWWVAGDRFKKLTEWRFE